MKARLLRRLLNVWPPLLFAGISIRFIADDYSQVESQLRLGILNRNIMGSHFGGSLFAMTDPFYMLMLMQRLGKDYVVWDKAASIDFVSPGRGTVSAKFQLSDQRLAQIRAAAEGDDKVFPEFDVDVVDAKGGLVARVHKVLYVRKKRPA